jgi:hypothetical protein|tara:strand:+ start:752 stop:1054 length:303 start_codon:yes stop_codon:yes gene_type:complete
MVSYSKMPIGLARSSDPLTSKMAAINLNPTKLEAKVLEIIKRYPYGTISEQIEHDMWRDFNIKSSSITPRYRKLLEKRLITITGTLKASSGRHQQLMRAV